MSEECRRIAVYEDLYKIPDNMIGQIIGGELFAMPRPSPRHIISASVLSSRISNPFHLGEGGPGGWVILCEPEIRFGSDTFVPELPGLTEKRKCRFMHSSEFGMFGCLILLKRLWKFSADSMTAAGA